MPVHDQLTTFPQVNQQTWFSTTIYCTHAISLPSLVETATSPFGQNLSFICCSPGFFLASWSRYHCGNVVWWTSSLGFAALTQCLYLSKWNPWMWWQQVVLEPYIKHSFSLHGDILFSLRVLLVTSLDNSELSHFLFEYITYLHKVHHLPFHVPFSCENCTWHLFIKINSRLHVLSVFVGMLTRIAGRWRALRSCSMVSTFISFRKLIYWCIRCLLRLIIIDLWHTSSTSSILGDFGWFFALCFPFFLLIFVWWRLVIFWWVFFLCLLTGASVLLALEAYCCFEDLLFDCFDCFGGGLFNNCVACLELEGMVEVLEMEFGLLDEGLSPQIMLNSEDSCFLHVLPHDQ